MECIVCYDKIDNDNSVKCRIDNMWIDLDKCKDCVIRFSNTAIEKYLTDLKKAENRFSMMRLLECGLPMKIRYDLSYSGKKIDELFYDSSYQSPFVSYGIDYSHEKLIDALNILYKNMCNDNLYNYAVHISYLLEHIGFSDNNVH